MLKRGYVNKRKSARKFSKDARRSKVVNLRLPSRGGHRL